MISDNVHKPQHYQQGHVEVIYAIEQTLGPEGFKAYCMGNWIKYKSRAAFKGNTEEDLKKAEVYLSWAVNGLPPLKKDATLVPAALLFSEGDTIRAKGVGCCTYKIKRIDKSRLGYIAEALVDVGQPTRDVIISFDEQHYWEVEPKPEQGAA